MGNHGSFKVGMEDRSGFPSFTISHFEGPVTYTSEGLLEKNSEVVSPDFVSLLRGQSAEAGKSAVDIPGAQSPGSTLSFVRGLFLTRALNTQFHPKSEQTIVSAQQSVKPMRAPSVRKPSRAGGTIRRAGTVKKGTKDDEDDSEDDAEAGAGTGTGGKKGGVRCIAGEFRGALDTLFETLEETKPWFIICLRPNDNQLPNQCEARVVKQQIKSSESQKWLESSQTSTASA